MGPASTLVIPRCARMSSLEWIAGLLIASMYRRSIAVRVIATA